MISDEAIAEIKAHEHVMACADVTDLMDQDFASLTQRARAGDCDYDDVARLIALARVGLALEKREKLKELGLIR